MVLLLLLPARNASAPPSAVMMKCESALVPIGLVPESIVCIAPEEFCIGFVKTKTGDAVPLVDLLHVHVPFSVQRSV